VARPAIEDISVNSIRNNPAFRGIDFWVQGLQRLQFVPADADQPVDTQEDFDLSSIPGVVRGMRKLIKSEPRTAERQDVMHMRADAQGNCDESGEPVEAENDIEGFCVLNELADPSLDLGPKQPKLVVRELVRRSDAETPDLTTWSERLMKGLPRPALSSYKKYLVTRSDEMPPEIEHEPLRAAVATFARRIEWVVCERDDQDIHDNPELSVFVKHLSI
jgi:hypothetical protein